jgi:hypothetical protein
MTQGRRKHWPVRLAFEPNRYASEQVQKAYEQLSPTDGRTTARAPVTGSSATKHTTIKRGGR